MLKLFNKEHVAIGALTDLKDYKIEYLLSGEDLVEFSLSISDEDIHLVEEEGYVRNKLNEYVIKAIDPSDNFKRFSCVVNVEDIKAKSIKSFDTSNNNITDTIRLAIAGTGWILADNNITKRRTVRVQNTNALEVLREVRKVFNIDFRFDAINKTIYVYEQFGSDKGVYFSDELNLRNLSIPSDTYDYATRLYCYGKDGLTISSVNNGKEYVDNFQYSNKVVETIWEDNRYTDANSLKVDAEAKLAELSKPKRSYQASVVDLAKQSEEYDFLDFFLGDTVTLLSKTEKFRDKQRIVKYIQYPYEVDKNTCELGNTTLTFEDLQRENEAKNNTVDNITSDNGTLDGSKVDGITTDQIYDFEASVGKITDLTVINAEITNLKAQNVTITGELNAVKANIGTLNVNVATIDNLTVTHTAQINNLIATSATITDLNATNATITNLEATVAKIQTLVSGNISSENIQAGGITSDKLTIANGFITNAMIENLDVSKVNAGDISTSKFRIVSDDGGIEIVGATQQFKDKNNKVRIQMGKDTQGNFNFIIRGEDGTTTLIDHTGVKAKAIADDLIVGNMISSDAVGEKQVDYSSFTTGFNKDTNTSTIKSTKVMLNNQNQTLEVAFNSLKTQADETNSLTESHSTTIGVMQGQITTAINNTQIIKDGETILLKDDYNRTVSTVNSMQSTIGKHTTQINEATGKISSVESDVNTISRDLEGTKSTVSSHTSEISGLSNTVSTQGSDITQLKGQISLKVEQTDITNSINGIQIGGRNLAKSSSITGYNVTVNKEGYKYSWSTTSNNHGLQINNSIFSNSKRYILTYKIKKTNGNILKIGGHCPHQKHNLYLDGTLVSGSYSDGITYPNDENIHTVMLEITFNAGDGNRNVYIQPNRGSTTEQYGVEVWDIQVKEGTKATDWTPAPEDVTTEMDTKITTAKAEIKIETDKISSEVSKHQQDLNWLSNETSRIDQKADGITSDVSKMRGDVDWLATESSRIDQKANQIQNTVSSIQGDYVGKSQFTQTVDNFEFRITHARAQNLMKNGYPCNGNTSGWSVQGNNAWFHAPSYGWVGLATSNTTEEVYAFSPEVLVQAGKQYSISFFMQKEVNVLSADAFIIGKNSAGVDFMWVHNIVSDVYSNDFIRYQLTVTIPNDIVSFKIRIDNNRTVNTGGGYCVFFGEFMVIQAPNCYPPIWYPAEGETFNNITSIDADGIKVRHENNSFSRINAKEFYQANENGERTISLRYGAQRYYKWQHNKAFVGASSVTRMTSEDDKYGITTFGTGNSWYLDFGFAGDYYDDGQVSNIDTWLRMHRINDRMYSYKPFNQFQIYNHVDTTAHHLIFGTTDTGRLCMFGDNGAQIGIKVGTANYKNFELIEDGSSSKGYFNSWGHWYFNNWTMYNMKTANTLEAQSVQLRGYSQSNKSINEVYGVSSYTDGEIRYTDRQEHCTFEDVLEQVQINGVMVPNEYYGRYTVMIEIPQILSENIEFDYHVSISKLSWGDYKILEKDPYYFILESENPNFRFTFEVMAKQIEKPMAFSVIASEPYTIVDSPDNGVSTDTIAGSKFSAMDDEQIEEELLKEKMNYIA